MDQLDNGADNDIAGFSAACVEAGCSTKIFHRVSTGFQGYYCLYDRIIGCNDVLPCQTKDNDEP